MRPPKLNNSPRADWIWSNLHHLYAENCTVRTVHCKKNIPIFSAQSEQRSAVVVKGLYPRFHILIGEFLSRWTELANKDVRGEFVFIKHKIKSNNI